ncbi:MAG: ABC transporter permease [Lachnospiraceae bacterium]|nr:ABC transporter permease [Lachnospiraceae bacterium]
MIEYLIKRVLQIIPVLLIVSFLIVSLTRMVPGDPVRNILGEEATQEQYLELSEKFGLDKPVLVQYVNYVKGLLHGDMGRTYFRNLKVAKEVGDRYPNTFKIAIIAAALSTVIGIILGVSAALHRGKIFDSLIMIISLMAVSTPIFFLCIILMVIFGVELRWLPVMGLSTWKHYVLPVTSLAAQSIATISRTMRSSMLDVLGEDYIRTAWACGIPRHVVIYKNAIRNAMIPVVTIIGFQFGSLLTGAAITESVFSINGMGNYMVNGVMSRDYPVVQGTILIFALVFVVVNLITDLCYGLFDPRISYK